MSLEKVKHIMMRKIWKIPVYLIIALLGASTVTAAVMYTLRIPSTITILPPEEGTYEIEIYEDEACTTEVTSFDFGELEMGNETTIIFYLKSLSTVSIDVHVSAQPDPLFSFLDPSWQHGIQSNEVREWQLRASVSTLATEGTFNFDLVFNVYPAG